MNVYAIFDRKAQKYGPIQLELNHFTVQRALSQVVNGDPNQSLLAKFTEDYDLYQVGSYDDQTGILTSKIEFVCNLIQIKDVHQE